jgi:hypothetical protein
MKEVEVEMVKSESEIPMSFRADRKVYMLIADEIYKRVERKFCQSLIESYEKEHLQ